MTIRHKRRIFALGLAGILLIFTGCDDGSSQSSTFSWIEDPPKVMLVAGARLVAVSFNQLGVGFRVTPVNGVQILEQSSSQSVNRISGLRQAEGGVRFGDGGDTTPASIARGEHEFDQKKYPNVDDYPLPSFFPKPDHPGLNPFEGFPPPPATNEDGLGLANNSDGSISVLGIGSSDVSNGTGAVRAAQDQVRAAKTTTIHIGAAPGGLSYSPDQKRIYVSYAQGIAVVDSAAAAVVDQIALPLEAQPYRTVIAPDGKRLYVNSFKSASAQVYTVDLASKTVVGSIPVGGYPAGIAITPDGSQVWVTSFFSGNITVIDTLTNTRTVVISNVSAAWGIAFNPTGTRAFVTSSESVGGSLRVIDTSTYSVIANIPTGNGPRAVAVTPNGSHVFVADYGTDTITQIDAVNNKVLRTIKVGVKPEGFQFLP